MNQLARIERDFISDMFRDLSFPKYLINPLYGAALPESINVEISETPEAISVQAEISGVNKEDINVSVEGRMLTISAEIKQNREEKKEEKVLKSERYYGCVSRSLSLSSDVDESKAVAHYENGLLTLSLPKAVGESGNRIMIS